MRETCILENLIKCNQNKPEVKEGRRRFDASAVSFAARSSRTVLIRRRRMLKQISTKFNQFWFNVLYSPTNKPYLT